MMLAAFAKSPAWAITVEESAKLSTAINNVTALYDVKLLDERGRAWLALGMVGVEVYGSRVATAILEAKKPKASTGSQAANVAPIRTPQQPQQPAATAFDYMNMNTPGAPA